MNGAQLAVEAQRIRPGLKVLLTSGYTAAAMPPPITAIRSCAVNDSLPTASAPETRAASRSLGP